MNADVVILGGGVIGASVAWHLAQLGVRRVVLLEREAMPGLGSTARATGGFRAQFATDVNVRLSLLSREKLLRFRDEVGGDPGYQQCGYLWLARTEAQLEQLRAGQGVQHAAGLAEATIVDREKIATLNPAVRAESLAGAAFCPTDGFLRPLDVLQAYLDGAKRRGVTVIPDSAPVEIRKAGSRIISIRTASQSFDAGAIVDAGGPWAAQIAELAGVTLPVTPLRRQIAATVPSTALPSSMPMTIFVEDGFHLRVRDGRILLLLPSPGSPGQPFDTSVEDSWIEQVAAIGRERVPVLAGVSIDRERCWAGLYEISPDRHAIVGPAPGCENLFFANGSSGHGVMHAPAIGQLVAQLIANPRGTLPLDISPLRPTRFDEGRPNPVSDLL